MDHRAEARSVFTVSLNAQQLILLFKKYVAHAHYANAGAVVSHASRWRYSQLVGIHLRLHSDIACISRGYEHRCVTLGCLWDPNYTQE